MEEKYMIGTKTVWLVLGWLTLIAVTGYLTRSSGQLSGHSAIILACSLALLCAWGMMIYASASMVRKNVIQADKIAAGVLNRKALRLPQPEMPAEARRAGASGRVNVSVLIAENGSVVAAQAVSGHPLLKKSAVAAATQAHFKPARIDDRYVKMSGTLVYDFSPRLSVMQIGMKLSAARFAPAFDPKFPAADIADFLPAEWEEEQETLEHIAESQAQAQLEIDSPDGDDAGDEIEAAAEDEIIVTETVYFDFLARLTDSLIERFAADEIENWSFALGLNLGKVSVEFADEAVLRDRLIELKQIAECAPAGLAPELVAELEHLTAHADNGGLTDDDKENIKTFLLRIS